DSEICCKGSESVNCCFDSICSSDEVDLALKRLVWTIFLILGNLF
ncbi:19103_t:CDS:1, partial [Racocetra persica]